MAQKIIDGTFYQGKADGGIDSYTKEVNGETWEVQELINDKGLVYYRLWILWNDSTTRDFYTKIRKQPLAKHVAPKSNYTKPF